ncbi:MAG: T9SS type B sorting domain-containing protein, partial [Saprospiraceae bacterium]
NGAPPPAIPASASNYRGVGNPAVPSIVAQLNAWAGCVAFAVAPNPIPANSPVMAFNSSVAASAPGGLSSLTPVPNLSSYCGTTTYVIAGNYFGAADYFKNTQSSHPLIINFGPCTTTVTYGAPSITNSDGNYLTCAGGQVALDNPGTGCFPPGCVAPTATATATGGPCFTPAQTVNLGVTTNAPAGSVYNWTSASGYSSNLPNPSVSGLPTGNNVFTVKVITPGGCFRMSSITITVSPAFNFTVVPDLTVCGSSPIALSVGGSPAPSAGANYLWSGPGLLPTNSATPNLTPQLPVSPATSSTNNYALTITETNGCKWLDTFKLTTVPIPPTLSIVNPINICTGQAINLVINSATMNWNGPISIPSGPNPKLPVATRFLWTGVSGFINNQVTDVLPLTVTVPNPITPTATGSYIYNLTPSLPGFSHSSCTMAPIDVTVNVQPGGAITLATQSICQGQSLDLNTLISAPAPAPLGSWSGTGVGVSPNFNSTALASGNYSVTFTPTAAACLSATSTSVTVDAAPLVNIAQSGNICGASSPYVGQTTLTATAGFTTYNWSSGVTGSADVVTVSSPGTYTVTVTNLSGCTAVKSINVSSLPNPNVTITAPTTLCNGVNRVLTLNNTFTSYLWNDNSTANTLAINNPGTYNITVTDVNGCTATDAKTIATASPLAPIMSPFGKICGTGSVILGLTGIFNSYAWSDGLGNGASVVVSTGQTYSVTVTETATGCTGVATANVQQFPNPTVDITGNLTFCFRSSTTLNADPATFSNYLWNTGSVNPSITVTAAQNYSLTVTDVNGCTGTVSKLTNFFPIPTPIISGSTSICSGSSTTLDAGAGYNSYLWSNGATSQTILTNQSGIVSVSVTDAMGCIGIDSKNIVNSGSLSFAITGNPSFCDGQSTTLNAGGGFTSYIWTTGETTQTITVNTSNTYAVTVSNGLCQGSSSIVATKNNLPTVSILGNASFCEGGSTALSTNTTFSSYRWNTNQTSQSIVISAPGTYSVSIQDNNGCTAENQITVSTVPSPKPAIIGKNSICSGDSSLLSLTETYNSYKWSTGTSKKDLYVKSFTNYSVTVTALNGCTGQTNFVLSQLADLKPVLQGKTEFCEKDTVHLKVNSNFSTYNWSTGSKANSIVVNQGGTYRITVNDGACQGVDSIKLTMNPLPVPKISKDSVVCAGQIVTFSTQNGYASYNWSSGEKTAAINTGNAGIYRVTISSAKSCSAIDSVKLTVNQLPNPILIGQSTICFGEKAILSLTEKYKTYLWSNGKSTDTIQVISAGKYQVSVSDNNGCTASVSKDVDIKNNLNPQILSAKSFCLGDSLVLTLDAPYASYKWSDLSIKPTLTVKKTGTYLVTVTSSSGCSGSNSISINENPNPSPVITGNLFICGSKTTTLDAGTGYAAYSWSNGDKTQQIIGANQGKYSVTVTSAAGCKGASSVDIQLKKVDGKYSDTLCKNEFRTFNGNRYDISKSSGTEVLLGAASGGCDSLLDIQLFFRPDVSVGLSGDTTICSTRALTLILNVTGFIGSFDAVMEDSDGVKTNLSNVKNGDLVNVQPNKTTTYTIISTTIANGNCLPVLGSAKITLSSLQISTQFSQITCSGKNNGAAQVQTQSGTSPFKYLWDTGATNAEIIGLKAGNYKVTVIDAIGCSANAEITISEPQPITATLNSEAVLCNSTSGTIIIEDIKGGSGNFIYSTDGTTFNPINGTPFKIRNLAAGDYTVQIREAAAAECNWSGKINIAESTPLTLSLGPDITLVYGDSVVLTPVTNFQMNTIRWTPRIYLSCDTCQFTIAKPKVTANYQVKVWDENGCFITDEIQIIVNKIRRVFIPTVFSPNVDGNNDLFRINLGDESVKVVFFRIFDRWGEMMYEDINFTKEESQDDKRGWNGYFKGKLLNPDVYIYSAQVEFSDGETKNYTGDFMLMKQ